MQNRKYSLYIQTEYIFRNRICLNMKVWLVWRTNVGKSTLFNKLLGTHRAIITDIHGTTREIISEDVELEWIKFELFDSPWLDDFKEELIYIQRIIDESDVVIFVLDAKQWLLPKDQQIKEFILNSNKKENTIVLINKCEWKIYNEEYFWIIGDFLTMWFDNVFPISAKVWEWLEKFKENFLSFVERLSNKLDLNESSKASVNNVIPISIVWRPNVWKSTLLNKYFGSELSKVKDESWTTLDYITCKIKHKFKILKLYDTAWIRRKWKITWIEKIAYSKTISLLQFIRPVTIVMLDWVEWITHRDMTIIWDIIDMKLPIIITINKIDLLDKKVFDRQFKILMNKFSFAKWIPVVPISAKEWISITKLLDFATNIGKDMHRHISTSALNQVLSKAWVHKPPMFPKNKICKWTYISQPETNPPTFVLTVNKKDNANFSFVKWIDNILREEFWFVGVPLRIKFKEKENPFMKKKK